MIDVYAQESNNSLPTGMGDLMRKCVSVLGLVVSFTCGPAFAESGAVVSDESLKDFCIFADKIYSVGSHFCSNEKIALLCSQDRSADKTARAAWVGTSAAECARIETRAPR